MQHNNMTNKKTMKNSNICRLVAIAVAGMSGLSAQAQSGGGGETWPPPYTVNTDNSAYHTFKLDNNFLEIEGVISLDYAKAWLMRWKTKQFQIHLAPKSDATAADGSDAGCLASGNNKSNPDMIKMDMYDPTTLAMLVNDGTGPVLADDPAANAAFIFVNESTNDSVFDTHYFAADNPSALSQAVTDTNSTVQWGINGYKDNGNVIVAPDFTAGYTGNAGFGVNSESTWTFDVADVAGSFETGGQTVICDTTVPISLSYAYMKQDGNMAKFSWATEDESSNLGFHVWVKVDDAWQLLNSQILATATQDSFESNRYTWSNEIEDSIQEFGISQVDVGGEEKFYGPYKPGVRYGSADSNERIDWPSVRVELDETMVEQGFERDPESGGYVRKVLNTSTDVVLTAMADAASAADATTNSDSTTQDTTDTANDTEVLDDVEQQVQDSLASAQDAVGVGLVANLHTNGVGVVRVGFNQLAALNIDLNLVENSQIAIANRGKSVSRYIGTDSNGERFIEFYAEEVDGVALQATRQNVYQITVDSSLVKDSLSAEAVIEATGEFIASSSVETDSHWAVSYATSDDQWFMGYAQQIAISGGSTSERFATVNNISVANVGAGYGVITAEVVNAWDNVAGAEADYDMYVNDTFVGTGNIDGNSKRYLRAIVPADVLSEGDNSFELRLNNRPGVTASRIYLDSVKIQYSTVANAADDVFMAQGKGSTDGYSVAGISANADVTAYAYDERSENLYRLTPSRDEDGNVTIASVGATPSNLINYWVGSAENLGSADIELINPDTTTDIANANYVIVTHENFKDNINTNYVDWKEAQSYIDAEGSEQAYDISVVDLKDVYDYYGGGLVDPSGLRNFLTSDAMADVEHVMLVGGASIDYGRNPAADIYNFIPSYYQRAALGHLSPSDGWLVDGDNDKVPDRAIGRLPVRTNADLDAIIEKTKNYATRTDNGLLVAYDDADDPLNEYYAKLATATALHDEDNYVELGSVALGNYAVQTGLRDGFNDHVATMVMQSHGSANTWGGGNQNSYAFLTTAKMKNLTEHGQGSLLYSMTCFTTFFVSTRDDTLSNMLMNSRFGAVAMAGSSIESMVQNNVDYTKRSIELTQNERKTIGQALTQARYETRDDPTKVISSVSWNLLGDPTLRATIDNLR